MNLRISTIFALLSLTTVSCADDAPTEPPDDVAGADADVGVDVTEDVGVDADAAEDTQPDVAADVPADTEDDVEPDSAPQPDVETDLDADSDSETGDAGDDVPADADVSDVSDADAVAPDADVAEDTEPDVVPTPELTRDRFSHVAQAALAVLDDMHSDEFGVTWDFAGDAQFESDWIVQSPLAEHWGESVDSLVVAEECLESPGCNVDFGLRECESDLDCTGGGICGALHATVAEPGAMAAQLCLGHSDLVLDQWYNTMVEAEVIVDITSLSPADGRFEAALRNALTLLSHSEEPPRARLLFGHIIGLPMDTEEILESLTRDIAAESSMQVFVGGYRIGFDSWNHAKIVAVDGQHLLEGGHNMWTGHYLTSGPVHDLSMRLEGGAAADAQRFVNRLWEYTCEDHSITGWTTRHARPEGLDPCPARWLDPRPSRAFETGVRTVSVGRLGGLGANPADDALLAMVEASTESVRLSIQDLGPVGVGPITIGDWPQATLGAFARAMVRGVDIEIVLSTPNSVPGGLGSASANYGNGWTTEDVVDAMLVWFEDNTGLLPLGTTAEEVLCDHFRPAVVRVSDEATWADEVNIGNHAKFFIVDDVAFYLGSQNLYEADLAEWGVIVDSPEMTAEILTEYWDPMWGWSRATVALPEGCAID